MSKIVLPKTCIGLLERQFDVWTTEYSNYGVEKMRKNFYKNEGILDTTNLKHYKIVLSISCDADEDDESENEEYWLEFEFIIKGTIVFSCKLDNTIEGKMKLQEFLQYDFVYEYQICECNKLVFKDEKCRDCYIFDYEHHDVCSICLQNGRKWIELDCGHVFHHSCWEQVLNEKCPLCRGSVKVKTYRYGFQ
jgi:hypothetical protein